MKKKNVVLTNEDDLVVDLTFHNVPASLLKEFNEKIVKPYYHGNINCAVQDLLHKALAEEDFVLSHITHIRCRDAYPKWSCEARNKVYSSDQEL